jgi:uncharacterized phage protein (TIGR02218 family)
MGFTDHDGGLFFDGTAFAAETGLGASAIAQSSGLSVDNAEVVGALSAAGVTETDIAAGRYDEARVEHWLVDWQDPSLRVLMFAGSLGEIVRGAAGFEAELRGLGEALNRPNGRVYLRDCDAVLGDPRCGIDARAPALMGVGSVAAPVGPGRFLVVGLDGYSDGWFTRGRLDWLAGANAGITGQLRSDERSVEGRLFTLWEELSLPILDGDGFEVFAGCDKRAATCRDKFANILNFRGFPHMPGEDWVNGYAREGDRHDGSSLFR